MKGLIFSLLLALPALGSAQGAPAEGQPKLSAERLILRTNLGDLVFALYPEVAPRHAARILEMARSGIFDGVGFYRLEPGFVLQTENFNSRKKPLSAALAATVTKIPAEFSQLKHRRGVLSMARFDDPNSAESSFSILLGDAPHLDGQYTIFGELVGGDDVLKALEAEPVNEKHEPKMDLFVTRADVIDVSALSRYPLEGAKKLPTVTDSGRDVFVALAGFVFFLTMAIPIYQALAPVPRPAPGRERA